MKIHKTKTSIIFILIIFFILPCLFINLPVCAEELEPIELLPPQFDRGKLLMHALKERKSIRSFSQKELPLDVLSNLLWAAAGVNRPESGLRTTPTAVNWQEIDIYVAMKKGLYLYNPKDHRLEPVRAKDIREYTGVQEFTQIAPVNLIYVANFSKMSGQFANTDTKVFYSATDTGFISQNVYLFCASEGLATVVIGWIEKPALALAMKLREEQKIILAQPVGYPE